MSRDIPSEIKKVLKEWTPPQIMLYGDMREITKGSQVYGSGDVGYEHQKPMSSAGPSQG